MSKFHMIPETGVVKRCHAEKGNCPYGGASGEENHYENIKEARIAYEEKMKDKTIATITKDEKVFSPEELAARKASEEAHEAWSSFNNKYQEKKKNDPSWEGSNEWYTTVQERRKLFFKKVKAEKDHFNSLPEVEKEKIKSKELDAKKAAEIRKKVWREKQKAKYGTYNFHPDIDNKTEPNARNVITSFTGLNDKQVEKLVKDKTDKGLSKTDAYREIFKDLPIRSDKKIVSIDLETAALMYENKFDNGPYSNIIEIGMVERDTDGTIKETGFLSGVPEVFKEVGGTGSEDVHNISLEMIQDKPIFVEDPDKQKQVLEALRGNVLMAHNARFEIMQLSYNVPGFMEAYKKGEIEVLDTMQVSKFYVPESENNTNEHFVKATGGEYEGAHRALEDARMSFDSFMRLKSEQKIEKT